MNIVKENVSLDVPDCAYVATSVIVNSKQMPMYQVFYEKQPVGIYSCQRPAIAACKAFTILRRSNGDLQTVSVSVQTEGRKGLTADFLVEYKHCPDEFLKLDMRPVATRIQKAQ